MAVESIAPLGAEFPARPPHERRGRLLVVGGQPDCDHLCQDLSERGYDVVAAAPGSGAPVSVTPDKIDLVLVCHNGLELLPVLREKFSALDLPIIAMIDGDRPEAVAETLRLGANDLLPIPVQTELLSVRLEAQLRILRLRAALRQEQELRAIACHELNSPLTAISGFAGFLESQFPPDAEAAPRRVQSLHGIRQSVVRIQKIMNELFDFQSLEEKRFWLPRVKTDLEALTLEILDQEKAYAQRKGVTVELVRQKEPVVISVDPDRIDRVLRNLICNAIKFCRPGCRVTITIRDEGHQVQALVSDDGPGLCDEDMLRAFRMFERLSNQPTGGETSSGLGLAICRRLVELHGGRIGVRNNERGGATFWFTLPIR